MATYPTLCFVENKPSDGQPEDVTGISSLEEQG